MSIRIQKPLTFAILIGAILIPLLSCDLPAIPSAPKSPENSETAPPTPEEIPAVEEPPDVPFHNQGTDAAVGSPNCFDLDNGTVLSTGDPLCDFTLKLNPGGDTEAIEFIPVPPAGFSVDSVYTEKPSLDQCTSLTGLTSGSVAVPKINYYVCYQTGEGRFGFLYLKSYAEDSAAFDWFTSTITGAIVAPPLEITPIPSDIHAEGIETSLDLPGCFDLDTGRVGTIGEPTCDFNINPDPSGEGQQIEFVPIHPAGIAFNGAFTDPPTFEQCMNSTTLLSRSDSISPQNYYHCYQTNEGRYGYMLFKAYNAANTTFDWHTFKASGASTVAAPEEEPIYDEVFNAALTLPACYDLDQARQAYEGTFESQTDIDCTLLDRVIHAKV